MCFLCMSESSSATPSSFTSSIGLIHAVSFYHSFSLVFSILSFIFSCFFNFIIHFLLFFQFYHSFSLFLFATHCLHFSRFLFYPISINQSTLLLIHFPFFFFFFCSKIQLPVLDLTKAQKAAAQVEAVAAAAVEEAQRASVRFIIVPPPAPHHPPTLPSLKQIE